MKEKHNKSVIFRKSDWTSQNFIRFPPSSQTLGILLVYPSLFHQSSLFNLPNLLIFFSIQWYFSLLFNFCPSFIYFFFSHWNTIICIQYLWIHSLILLQIVSHASHLYVLLFHMPNYSVIFFFKSSPKLLRSEIFLSPRQLFLTQALCIIFNWAVTFLCYQPWLDVLFALLCVSYHYGTFNGFLFFHFLSLGPVGL